MDTLNPEGSGSGPRLQGLFDGASHEASSEVHRTVKCQPAVALMLLVLVNSFAQDHELNLLSLPRPLDFQV